VVEEVKAHFRKNYKIIDIDGARIPFGDGWGLVRASNTQPVLVLRFEALSEERLQIIREIVENALHTIMKKYL
jgi:phosphomannomutase/phosphoglucomutase